MSGRPWLPPLVWAAIILVLTTIPVPQAVSVPGGDKTAHVLMYAVLGFLTMRAAWRAHAPSRSILLVVLAIAAFGAFNEVWQGFVGRTPELLDWFADVVGASLGAMAAAVQIRARERYT
ncbi:MAG TPA: VanZ family protein [Gemmatimonadaceae bacterium]|nr:VanZ family protein [Gemmatimonadaceae bacterium]